MLMRLVMRRRFQEFFVGKVAKIFQEKNKTPVNGKHLFYIDTITWCDDEYINNIICSRVRFTSLVSTDVLSNFTLI